MRLPLSVGYAGVPGMLAITPSDSHPYNCLAASGRPPPVRLNALMAQVIVD
jgi:hypothetical protein